MLLEGEEWSGSACLQVLECELEACAFSTEAYQPFESSSGGRLELGPVGYDEVDASGQVSSSDASAQLVEVGDAESFGLPQEEGTDVGEVQAGTDDGGCHQNGDFPFKEGFQALAQGRGREFAVGSFYCIVGESLLEGCGDLVDVADSGSDDECLSLLVQYGLEGLDPVVGTFVGE